MILTIPVYVQQLSKVYRVRPLFAEYPVESNSRLERALVQLELRLHKRLSLEARSNRQDPISEIAFCPVLHWRRVKVVMELRNRIVRVRALFVEFQAFERRVVFSPDLPQVWFEVTPGDSIHDRANEVLTGFYRQLEKDDCIEDFPPENLDLDKRTAWIQYIDVEVDAGSVPGTVGDKDRMFLGSQEEVHGQHELFRVAECLDHLFPDLDRARLREAEVQELTDVLKSPDRRPVLLLGPPMVGKTTLLTEYVYRAVKKRSTKQRQKIENLTWQISPQRLISGMSYVGQWENRLIAILRYAKEKDHILFFDNFLGLYRAGVHSQSDLSAAHVLKPYAERQEVRIVTEMTHEMFRILREQDRGFADLFHILPVKEGSERETLQMLIAYQRQAEGQYQCRLSPDVLPTVINLQRRYARHLAFPGKAAHFLQRLAVKNREANVSRDQALQEFQARSGMTTTFVDQRQKLDWDTILRSLSKDIIGQDAALHAAVDVISIAKARLNDPDRPLASLLFLGPTGVGKTQTAKALAKFLFGDADKLLRFDMNEYLSPGSAARLVGTFYQPEGLLTSAVRRQPFAVILLDEIEKADPEVYDLLLQVLGEGRLTDAHGRVADFTNTIIILTSNLGVKEAQGRFGLQDENVDRSAIFLQAAERFFRPEFFNRLDRIIPFGNLSRDDVWKIAQLLIHEVLQREGLVRRKCILTIDENAHRQIVESGYDPDLGARALKRTIERRLTQPVAIRLAQGLPDTVTLIHLYSQGEQIAVHVQGLDQVPAIVNISDTQNAPTLLAAVKAFVHRIREDIQPMRPEGEITSANTAEYYVYFTLRDELALLQEQIQRIEEAEEPVRKHGEAVVAPYLISGRGGRGFVIRGYTEPAARMLQEMAAAQDVHDYFRDLIKEAPLYQGVYEPFFSSNTIGQPQNNEPFTAGALALRTGLLQSMADAVQHKSPDQVLIHIRYETEIADTFAEQLHHAYLKRFQNTLHVEAQPYERKDSDPSSRERNLLLRGVPAVTLAKCEVGTHLFCPKHGSMILVQVLAWPIEESVSADEVYRTHLEPFRKWQEQRKHGQAGMEENPFHHQSVVRIYNEDENDRINAVDLRTGLIARSGLFDLQAWVLAALALPEEVEGVVERERSEDSSGS